MRLHATGAQLFVSVIPPIALTLPLIFMETLAQKRFRRRRRGAPLGRPGCTAVHTGLLNQSVLKPAV